MSEYQYYEFAAVDRPLTPQLQAELRSRSSRATITPGSFINEYQWGDLKGDPVEWMRHYFDAHVYSANWGSCRFMLRLPAALVDRAMLDACVRSPVGGGAPIYSDYSDAFEARFIDDLCLLDWSFYDDNGEYERFWSHEDGPGWMQRLLPLRDELLRGDMRPLYLGWLARVCSGQVGDDDLEPPLPTGLAALTMAQQALAEFMELDPDWLSAAAAASPEATQPAEPEHDAWLAEQSEQCLRDSVRLLLEGRGLEAERNTRLAFLAWQANRRPNRPQVARRRVADIALGLDAARERRLERERQERAEIESKRQAERLARLATLAADPQRVWREIDARLKRGSGAGYDQALQLTQALAEALTHTHRQAEFRAGLATILETHDKRRAWLVRLEKAGLLNTP